MPCATQKLATLKTAVGGPRIGGTFAEVDARICGLRPVTSPRAMAALHQV
jgi:hypothetical protein